ncbi:exodeoxyribonuclease V alpha subunit [Desulfosarcina sp. BuS5]|uniref:exodeoxyribonuclease V subunit alpha n=1 Tax=Desulfosarcina sp. BuS5 TaxID=933262 RepID=UPI000488AD07|nr:exodeoxyribonuclease V subunit alpha [Desulfosarcina sp. BuS5]WDN90296.1 exodeoxyribonuclease V alpha subunit [Desulfosarcina sp. BuS5]
MGAGVFEYSGLFNSIDIRFANFIARISENNDPDILLGAALVSNVTGDGNVCLDLASFAGRALTEMYQAESAEKAPPVVCPEISTWRKKLLSISAVGRPGDYCPLIMDDDRLYLYRYWEYEKKLADSIRSRVLPQSCNKICDRINFDFLNKTLAWLFPGQEQAGDRQRAALINVVFNNFTVITGGPGTGKTTVITKIIAILLALAKGGRFKILMAAPTGKAAARLSESITAFKEQIDYPDSIRHIRDAIPTETFTIHRMLGTIPNSPYFRHNSDNPLLADLVIIDEASMVDLALMSKLVQAVPDKARLVLVGDKDQLASVESGSVLGDISSHGDTGASPIRNAIIDLKKNYRFSENSGIGKLSRCVKNGDAAGALAALKKGEGVIWKKINQAPAQGPYDILELHDNLKESVVKGFSGFLETDDPDEAIAKLKAFKILSPVKQGPFGVFFLNRIAEQILFDEGLIKPNNRSSDPWYPGRPVLITRNDYNLQLFNGDIGIIMPAYGSKTDRLYAFFSDHSGGARRFLPWILPEHETVFAMTVHKSQGSEFDDVLMILPEKDTPVLTRELIYTGITRARQSLTILGTEAVLKAAISRRIERASGLRDYLYPET